MSELSSGGLCVCQWKQIITIIIILLITITKQKKAQFHLFSIHFFWSFSREPNRWTDLEIWRVLERRIGDWNDESSEELLPWRDSHRSGESKVALVHMKKRKCSSPCSNPLLRCSCSIHWTRISIGNLALGEWPVGRIVRVDAGEQWKWKL